MRNAPRKTVAVFKVGLGAYAEVTAALADHYEVRTAESVSDLADCLSGAQRPDVLVMAADLRLHATVSRDAEASRLLERIMSGRLSLIVVTITDTSNDRMRKDKDVPVYGILPKDGVNISVPPCDAEDLRHSIAVLLGRRHYRRLARLKSLAPPVCVFFAVLGIWEASCRFWHIKEYILPAPSRIVGVMSEKMGSLLFDAGVTLLEALLGFIVANVLSLFLAVGFSHSRWLERSLYPYTIALKSVPVVAVAPLLVLWFGYGLWGKVVMAAIIAFFPLVVNATLGLKAVDDESLDLMRSLSASSWKILVKLRFPTAVPYIISALKISSTMAVVGAIIGELIGAQRGIGYVILISSYNLDTPTLFAAITLASLIGILFFGAMVVLERAIGTKYFESRSISTERVGI
jgi:NitT/TauT family transport system permease protein